MSKSKRKKQLQRVYPNFDEIELLPSIVADNHTHIDLGNSDFVDKPLTVDSILKIGKKVGVKKIVQSGTSLKSSIYSSKLALEHKNIIASIGIHPNEAPALLKKGIFDKQLNQIKEIAIKNEKIKGIGETGLDFFRTPSVSDQTLQKKAFIKHINLANELNLAMQIHDREAHKEIIDTLIKEKAPAKTIFHCYSGDKNMAEFISKKGWYLSFAGNITFNANHELREALKY